MSSKLRLVSVALPFLVVAFAVMGIYSLMRGGAPARDAESQGPKVSALLKENAFLTAATERVVDLSLSAGGASVRVREGAYGIEAFAEPKRAGVGGAPLQTAPLQRLVVPPSASSRTFKLTPSELGLDACCADNFQELQVHYRDLNPQHPVNLNATVTYERPIAARAGQPPRTVTSRFIAIARGQSDFALGRELFETNDLPWERRHTLYPLWRMLGWTSLDRVSLTTISTGGVAQITPRWPLGGARAVNFEFDRCAELTELNLRIRSEGGTALMLDQLRIATLHETSSATFVSLDLSGIRQSLGRPSDDTSLELFEIIAFFSEPSDHLALCRPLRRVLIVDDGVDSDVPTTQVKVPILVEQREAGRKVLRIGQSLPEDRGNWGHLIRDIVLEVLPGKPVPRNTGIEVLGVSLANPPVSIEQAVEDGPAAAAVPDPCKLAAGGTGDPAIRLELDGMCPAGIKRTTLNSLELPQSRETASLHGVKVVPDGAAKFRGYITKEGLTVEARFQADTDSMTLELSALDVVPYSRIVEAVMTADDATVIAPRGATERTNQRHSQFMVPAGQAASVKIRRIPTADGRTTDHRFVLSSVHAVPVEPRPSRLAGAQSVQQPPGAQRISWSSRTTDATAGAAQAPVTVSLRGATASELLPSPFDRDEQCQLAGGVKICGTAGLAVTANDADGLKVAGMDLSAVTMELAAPGLLKGPSAVLLTAKPPVNVTATPAARPADPTAATESARASKTGGSGSRQSSRAETSRDPDRDGGRKSSADRAEKGKSSVRRGGASEGEAASGRSQRSRDADDDDRRTSDRDERPSRRSRDGRREAQADRDTSAGGAPKAVPAASQTATPVETAAVPEKPFANVRIELQIETKSGQRIHTTITPNEVLPLLTSDDTVTNVRLTLHPLGKPLDISLREMSYIEYSKQWKDKSLDQPAQQILRLGLEPAQPAPAGAGLAMTVLGDEVLIEGRISEGAPRVLAEWSYSRKLEPAEVLRFRLASSWQATDCNLANLEIETQVGSNTRNSLFPLCIDDEIAVLPSALLPTDLTPGATVEKITARVVLRPGAAQSSVARRGLVSLVAEVEGTASIASILAGAPIVSLGSVSFALAAGAAEKVPSFWTEGGWIPLGRLNQQASGTVQVRPIDHPILQVRAVRLKRLDGQPGFTLPKR